MLRIRLLAAPVVAVALLCAADNPRSSGRTAAGENSAASRVPVDINHASLEQLLTIPGLTRTWAQRIIRFRPYRAKSDLFEEGVLPGPLYYRIRDYIIAHRDKQ